MVDTIISGHIINEDFFNYVADNENCTDTLKLLLKNEPNLSFDKKFAVLQIDCRRRFRKKIAELLENRKFLFPLAVSAEQCTHELIAKFHGSLFNPDDVALDMTAGMGVDSYYISRNVKHITSIELNEEIAPVTETNMRTLGADNVTVMCGNSVDFLESTDSHFDKIFIDPARRGDNNKRLFGFADCQPNVVALLPIMQQKCNSLIIKASPMIDITQSLIELEHKVTDIWIIGVKNECKELLFMLDFQDISCNKTPNIHTINFDNSKQTFDFSLADDFTTDYGTPQIGDILLEPNVCIMKANAFSALGHTYYNIKKLHQSTHLFVNDSPIEGFPGRQFRITEMIPFKDKDIKKVAKSHSEINVSTRNFRLTAEALKKKLKVRDGGQLYLFGTTLCDGTMWLIIGEKA